MLRVAAIIVLVLASGAHAASPEGSHPSAADATLALLKPTKEEAPTREAAERLRSIEASRVEREHYQLTDLHERLSEHDERRGLALWYVRALLRARLSRLVALVKERWRADREHDEIRRRAAVEAEDRVTMHGAQPAPATSGGQARPPGPAQAAASQPWLSGLLADVSQLVARLTGDGVTGSSGPLAARVRLDLPGAAVLTELNLPRLSFGALTRFRSGGQGLPFSGGGEEGAERFLLWGGHTFPLIGVGGSVSYQVEHRLLSCTLNRHIVGPINAQLGRSWDFGAAGGPMTSIAALSMALSF